MDGFVVRMRGLPWSATPDDVASFFDGCKTAGGLKGIHLTQSREGRSTGQAFVEFDSEDDIQKALEKNNGHIGSRYIEVFRSKKSEMDWVVRRSGPDQGNPEDACVKLRGLPFGCSKEEVAQFFAGFEIVPNGIMLPEDRMGRSTGEAFVQFASEAIAEKALGKHKERIGHRYIEIFKSCLSEAHAMMGRDDRGYRSMGRPGPYERGDRFGGSGGMGFGRGPGGRNVKGYYGDSNDYRGGSYGGGYSGGGGSYGGMMGGRGGHWVRMRGLPFQAMERDITEFFAPVKPVQVNLEYSDGGRPSGVANVEFANHDDAQKAMKKHKSNMQHRYIELFLNSSPEDVSFGGASGMGGGVAEGNMGSAMGSAMGNMGSTMGNMGSAMGNGGFGAGVMGYGFDHMGNGGNMGGYSGGQEGGQYSGSMGQYGNGNQYANSGGAYMGSSNGQGANYANQAYIGEGGGYSNMGSSTMTSLANSNYTAF
ncbi:hypothetical protein ACOMHN_002085 [Nucella lapillus]